jgi:WD40 repeat protein
VAFSPDGKLLASANIAGNDAIRLWDVPGRKLKRELLLGKESFVRSLAFSPDGKTLAFSISGRGCFF